jgi:hypothetical protein
MAFPRLTYSRKDQQMPSLWRRALLLPSERNWTKALCILATPAAQDGLADLCPSHDTEVNHVPDVA